jgi:hypothetical protein
MLQRYSEFEAVKEYVPGALDSWTGVIMKRRALHRLILNHNTRYDLKTSNRYNTFLDEDNQTCLAQLVQTMFGGLRNKKGTRQQVMLYSDSHGRDIAVKLHKILDNWKIEGEAKQGAGMLDVTKNCIRDSTTFGPQDFVVIMRQ